MKRQSSNPVETDTNLRTKQIIKVGEFFSKRLICIDCEKEGFEIMPIPKENLGQWTYLYECPRCHRTATDIDIDGMKISNVY